MNRDQIKGGFKDTAGRIQRKFGQLFGNNRQEASGATTQAEGKTQKTVGDVSDTLGKAKENLKDTLKR
ncbi:MAG TPA: CsbD family protein [Noviherbaspirillum sp.]|uniref:CsbD family protein n=1 Tax=Noviherbaspirillum sp. TaxID=1926288 RepID=UPI002D3ED6CB|nr:CsbD family protein [Noviherbaspirillum sp.]HYD95313.1 CsbD family protein [Noviherbaspirillum sp.]